MDEHRRSPFGKTLRQLREAAGLSQEELAERAGLSARGVSDLERGVRTTPRLETVRMLAGGLELDEVGRGMLLEARNVTSEPAGRAFGHASPSVPVPVTSFIGREDELAELVAMLRHDHVRLVTLTGPGGVGKTRIAIKVAHRLMHDFEDGAVFVDLSTVRNRELVLPTIASRLGVSARAGTDLPQSLYVALQGRRLLLVLDNLEQVIDAAIDIAGLLAACPTIAIIATSRVLLRIAAEHVLPIDPLTLPEPGEFECLQQNEAVSLFVTRAHAADHHLTLTRENAATIVDLVTHLQGMPLAIELAAARVRMLTVAELLRRLEQQLTLLTGGASDTPERHRTMRNTIAWSYDLLSPTEQLVFRTLSIFTDGCTIETAVAICGVEGRFSESEIIDAVESLVDSSMLRRRGGVGGEMRFRMLQTLQEFGLEKLTAAGEEAVVREAAHAAWAVPLARACEALQFGPDPVFWLNQVEADQQNLRQHQAWLIANDYVQDALDISGSLAPFRSLRAQLDEGRRELELLLAHPLSQDPTRARVRAYSMLGSLSMNQGDTGQALGAYQESMALARQLDERWYLADALILMGAVLGTRGQLEEAEARAREGLEIATELNSTFLLVRATGALALGFSQRGEVHSALDMWEKALAMSQSIGNPWGMALCMNNLAYTCIRNGEFEKGETLLMDARVLLIELGDKRDLPGVDANLANLARSRGDLARATQLLESALGRATKTGNMYDIAHCNLGMSSISRLRGDLNAARSFIFSAITWFERCGDVIDAVFCLGDVADILIGAGDPDRAAWCIGALDGMFSRNGLALSDLETAERQTRVDAVLPALGQAEWQAHYDSAYIMSEEEVLAEVKAWLQAQ